MKKIIAVFLLLTILITCLFVPVFAQDNSSEAELEALLLTGYKYYNTFHSVDGYHEAMSDRFDILIRPGSENPIMTKQFTIKDSNGKTENVEYEYFYMNGELSISKIINKSRRRNVMELNDRMIRLVAALGSAELEEFYDLKKLDFTANNPFELPYVIVFEVNGVVKAMNIQMNDELYKSLKYNMPSKVKKNKCECYF